MRVCAWQGVPPAHFRPVILRPALPGLPAMYASCPKCGHAPLPQDQASPAACPACGIILAKFAARAEAGGAAALPRSASRSPREDVEDVEVTEESAWAGRVKDLFTHVPREVSSVYWQGRCAALAVAVLWTVFIFLAADVPKGSVGSNFLHGILLIFHEAGHVIFMPFGQFITILGGTLGQLLMPLLVGGTLLIQRRDPFGAALFAWLLGFSVMDMAVYMYDAFDPQLTLLGGGTGQESDGHDWQNMFGDLGLIRRARGIGQFFGVLGRLMMMGALAWAAWVLFMQRRRVTDNPMAEDA